MDRIKVYVTVTEATDIDDHSIVGLEDRAEWRDPDDNYDYVVIYTHDYAAFQKRVTGNPIVVSYSLTPPLGFPEE